jgi:hypothetical protein
LRKFKDAFFPISDIVQPGYHKVQEKGKPPQSSLSILKATFFSRKAKKKIRV